MGTTQTRMPEILTFVLLFPLRHPASMAANLSARKRASLVLSLPAVQLAGAFLGITCHCDRMSWLHVPELAISGRGVTLAEGIRKLRCSECRSPARRVVLAPRYPPQYGDERRWLVVWG